MNIGVFKTRNFLPSSPHSFMPFFFSTRSFLIQTSCRCCIFCVFFYFKMIGLPSVFLLNAVVKATLAGLHVPFYIKFIFCLFLAFLMI